MYQQEHGVFYQSNHLIVYHSLSGEQFFSASSLWLFIPTRPFSDPTVPPPAFTFYPKTPWHPLTNSWLLFVWLPLNHPYQYLQNLSGRTWTCTARRCLLACSCGFGPWLWYMWDIWDMWGWTVEWATWHPKSISKPNHMGGTTNHSQRNGLLLALQHSGFLKPYPLTATIGNHRIHVCLYMRLGDQSYCACFSHHWSLNLLDMRFFDG